MIRAAPLLIALALSAAPAFAQAPGRYLLALSDVDMVATGYRDGKLGPAVAQPDTLSIFDLRSGAETAIGSAPAPNSVNSPTSIMDVSADGRTVVVVETWEARTPAAAMIDDLKPGHRIRAFDISDPPHPRLTSEAEVPERPVSVSISPAGDLVLVATARVADGLIAFALNGGKLSAPTILPLQLVDRPDVDPIGSSVINWHPSGTVVAIDLMNRSQVAFYKMSREGGMPRLAPWRVVGVNKFPLAGKFTPDGRFYITFDAQWGRDVRGGSGTRSEGILTTIRVGEIDSPDPAVGPGVVNATMGGWQSESMAISPDGTLLALANIRGSTNLPSDPTFDPRASISLYTIDRETGVPRKAGEYYFDVANPQGVAFDADSRTIYVGVSEYRGEAAPLKGVVEAWRVLPGAIPSLERSYRRYRAPRGVNYVAVAR